MHGISCPRRAEGETSRFLQTLKEYKKAPEITRKRLYLETMEAVLANSTKVIMDKTSGNSLMYLPIDKLMESASGSALQPSEQSGTSSASTLISKQPVRRNSSSRQGDR